MSLAPLFSVFVSFALFWIFLHWLWRDYGVDRYRQDLFQLRDQLFDLGRAGVVAFTHPAYRLERDRINGMICLAERVHMLTAIAFAVRPRRERAVPIICSEMPGLTGEASRALRRVELRHHAILLRHLVYSSPYVSLFFPVIFAIVIARVFVPRARAWMNRQVERAEPYLQPIDDLAVSYVTYA